MRAPSNLQLAGIFFVITLILMVLIVTRKTTKVTEAPASYSNNTIAKYVDEAKQQNDLERDQREQADKLEKLAKAKRFSVECQFWKQQKEKQTKQTNLRTDEKIIQFCELPQAQTAASAAAPL